MIDRVRCSSIRPEVAIPTTKQQHPKSNHRIDAPDDPTYAMSDPPLSGVLRESVSLETVMPA